MLEKEKILQRTRGGLDVFQHYLGADVIPGRKFRNPLYDDKNASCNIYYGNNCGRYFLVDFGDSNLRGDCFWFVSKMFGIDYRNNFEDILRTIDKDLCLGVFNDNFKVKYPVHSSSKATTSQQLSVADRTDKEVLPFKIDRNQDMTDEDMEYWDQYGITQSTLSKYHVCSLKTFQSERHNGEQYEINAEGKPFFGYLFEKNGGIKVYRPDSSLRFMYAGQFPHPYIFGMEQLPFVGETLYITGGEKDVLSLASHGFNAICLNSETAKMPQEQLETLSRRFDNLVYLYDMDTTGVKESEKRVQEAKFEGVNNVYRLTLPLSGTKQEKDISDFFKTGHDAEELQRLTDDIVPQQNIRAGFRR